MGTLKNQLAELKMAHRLPEVLEEVVQIRKELGYPIMATPYSQMVGAQAVFNITSDERYRMASDEIIKYVSGIWGETDGPVDQDIKDRILSLPKARKYLNWRVPDVTVADLRREIGPGLSDEELLLRLLDPQGEVSDKLRTLYGKT